MDLLSGGGNADDDIRASAWIAAGFKDWHQAASVYSTWRIIQMPGLHWLACLAILNHRPK